MSHLKDEEFIKAQKEVQADYDKMKASETEIIDLEEFEKSISELLP